MPRATGTVFELLSLSLAAAEELVGLMFAADGPGDTEAELLLSPDRDSFVDMRFRPVSRFANFMALPPLPGA